MMSHSGTRRQETLIYRGRTAKFLLLRPSSGGVTVVTLSSTSGYRVSLVLEVLLVIYVTVVLHVWHVKPLWMPGQPASNELYNNVEHSEQHTLFCGSDRWWDTSAVLQFVGSTQRIYMSSPSFLEGPSQKITTWVSSYQGSWGRCWALVCGWTRSLWEFWPLLHNLRPRQKSTWKKKKTNTKKNKVREVYSQGTRAVTHK